MSDASRREPRLRMGHLLLWIVGCAIGLAERRPTMLEHVSSTRDRAIIIGYSVVSGLAIGTILTGCGLMAYRRRRGDASYPSRAGHWLLIRALVVHATILAANHVHLTPFAYLAIVAMVELAFFWGLRRRLPRHWAAVFLVSALLAAVRAIGFGAFDYGLRPWPAVEIGSSLLNASVTLRAIDRDRRPGAPADGLHRLGVGLALALDVIYLIFGLVWLAW